MIDIEKLANTEFQPRTFEMEVHALADFLTDKAEKPIWTVRGLTACEIAMVNESVEKHKLMDIISLALASNADKAEQLKQLLGGLNDDTPRDFMLRCSRLVICSVNPTLDLSQTILFSQAFPIEFQLLTNKILELTGMGMDIKK